jgi:FMN-dependent NADH-azoreductase
MMKTLIVQYAPRMERSSTKNLSDYFRSKAKGTVEVLDIAAHLPPMFSTENIGSYFKKYYNKAVLEGKEKEHLAPFEDLVAQLKSADVVVLAFPMYNFSLPAAVKAYFDAVLLMGETWIMDDKGYHGLMAGKKALIISTSGGVYSAGPMAAMNHSFNLATDLFKFMGFGPVEVVLGEGINYTPEKKEHIMAEAKAKLDTIAKNWYG